MELITKIFSAERMMGVKVESKDVKISICIQEITYVKCTLCLTKVLILEIVF